MPEDSGRTAEGDLFRSISEDLKNGRLEPIEEDESPKNVFQRFYQRIIDFFRRPPNSPYGLS